MSNKLLEIGPITIYGYGLMIAIGIIAAYVTAEYRAKRWGLDSEQVFGFTMCAVIAGFLGSKILHSVTIIDKIIADPSILLDFANGWVVYGGIIGGVAGAYIYCRVKKLSFLKYFDLAIPSVALAQGFGRIGCIFAGCCYGMETNSAFHVVFHNSELAPNDIALVPTQLLSSIFNFGHYALLILFAKKWKKGDGQVGALYFIVYSIGRFVIEFYRGDLIRGHVGSISTSQFIAIFTFAVGVALFIWFGRKKKDTCCESEM